MTFETQLGPQLVPPLTREELLGSLRTSHVPPLTVKQTSQGIRHAQDNVKLLDRQMKKLQLERFALTRDIALYGSLHSPARKLPTEVLRPILGFACSDLFTEQWKAPAFRLGGVCSRWRDIILDSPELWATLRFSLKSGKSNEPVRLSILRSKNYPLSIELHDDDKEDDSVISTTLLEMIKAHCFRWQSLTVSQGVVYDLMECGYQFEATPILESIYGVREIAITEMAHLFPSTPRLRSLLFLFEETGWDPRDSFGSIPWGLLHDIGVREDDAILELPLEVLRSGSALQTFVYTGSVYVDKEKTYVPSAEPTEYIVSPKILALLLQISPWQSSFGFLSDIVRHITLPALASFSIHLEDMGDPQDDRSRVRGLWPSASIHGFLKRSDCTLTTLSLKGVSLSDSDVLSLLKVTPSLVSFTLHELKSPPPKEEQTTATKLFYEPTVIFPVTKHLLEALKVSYSTDSFYVRHPLVPKLQVLDMSVEHPFSADKAFVEFVGSRWDSVDAFSGLARLRTVVLRVNHPKLEESAYEPLKRLDHEGLMISVFGLGVRVI